ncbi:MAG: alpha/beta hydrolase [Gluconacetobacter diazotrophicus]|nr:alpha/beta hydrolase [Gluconacetobacter diazotrophicus]
MAAPDHRFAGVDPELLPMLDMLPELTLSANTLARTRAMLPEMLSGGAKPDPSLGSIEEHDAGGVSVRVHTPAGGDPAHRYPAVLHIHGGGYVMGSAAMGDAVLLPLAAELACVIVSVEYRLAPEHPHPAPVEDCYRALRWIWGEGAERIRIDPARVAVMGESAGGGLAAALALLARDRAAARGDGRRLVFQSLIYPMLDDRTVTNPDPNPHVGRLVWTADSNHFGWTALLGREPGGEGVPPYAAAARAEDLRGLPPAFVSVGGLDLFLEEDLDYARRLMRAGVPTELHVFPGAFHGFDMAPTARSAMVARNRARSALRSALHPRR